MNKKELWIIVISATTDLLITGGSAIIAATTLDQRVWTIALVTGIVSAARTVQGYLKAMVTAEKKEEQP